MSPPAVCAWSTRLDSPWGCRSRLRARERSNSILPRTNAFGLSNTAYRSDVLRACLPIPAAAALVDWYLITMAWLQGARLAFDPTPRMDYRQHGANMARIRSPFTAERVRADTALVREHFRLVLDGLPAGALPARVDAGPRSRRRCRGLRPARRRGRRPVLSRYVRELNAAPPPLVWWASVAHPPLRSQWSTQKEPT